MAKAKVSSSGSTRKMRPALTPEAREKQMISLAMDQAEKQLLEGTASSQVICHFLKLASSKEKLEKERLEEENKLLRAKADAIKSAETSEELYRNAIKAFSRYSGHESEYNDDR